MTPRTLLAALVLAAAALTGCSSTEVDEQGRWVGGGAAMEAWTSEHVPRTWTVVDQDVTYGSIIDDFGEDTGRDETTLSARYRDVTETEFAAFGRSALEIRGDLYCEPYDAAAATAEEKPSVKSCYLERYQGQSPMPREIGLFAVWTAYPDGTTTTDLYLSNAPD